MEQIWGTTTLCDEFKPRRRPRSVVVEVQESKKHITCSATVKVLSVALALMFVCCLILLNLYLTQRAKRAKEVIVEKPRNSTSEKPTHELFYGGSCWSTDCLNAASDLLDSIDPSVDPCEDFYRYSCGGWMKKHPKPPGAIIWDQFQMLDKENNRVIEMLLKDKEMKARYSREGAVWKAMAYYDSCIDVKEIEQLKGEPLQRLIKRFGSWSITDKHWKEEDWELLEHIVQVHKYLALPVLFTMSVRIDNKNSSKTVIKFSNANTVLTPRELLTNDTESQRVREAYQGLMVNMTRKLGATKASEIDIIKIFEFEQELAKIAPRRSRMPFLKDDFKTMTLQQLEEYTGHLFNWTTYVKMMMAETVFHVHEQVEVIVSYVDYLKRLAKLISITPKRTLANYLMWRVTKAKFQLLSGDFKDIYKNFYLQAFNYWRDSGNNEFCLLATMQNFGTPLSKVLLDQKFYGYNKKLAIGIIEDIRTAFISNLKKKEWMDEETRLAAEEKAEALIENVGYPDYVMDVDHMSNMFQDVEIHPKTYFDNDISATRHWSLNKLRKAGKLVDRSDWLFPPTVLRAFYSYNENKMVFPAAILQPPFYNMRYPRAINYGAIGGIMAHEITHGFDDKGKMYDSQGNQRKWWSTSTLKNFHEKSLCLVNQYSNYTFFGYQVQGKNTLSENIADNGSVRVALEAYRKWVSDHWEEPRLPGMMLTNEQVFFVGFARKWCSHYTKRAARFEAIFSEHSPMPWRVNGTLMNFPEFARAFNCPIGSPMNPEKKCEIW